MKKNAKYSYIFGGVLLITTSSFADVKITEEIASVNIKHKEKSIKIKRIQDTNHRLTNSFTKTSRECPPFCIQPMYIEGIKTVGEIEVLEFLQEITKGVNALLVDARTSEWFQDNTIPGSINLPFTMLNKGSKYLDKILKILGAEKINDKWNFDNVVKILVFSNGIWDGQAPKAIKNLIGIGYPKDKILYYRGGMQNWQNVGLTTVRQ